MSEELTCAICEANFRPRAMVGNKCTRCATEHPDANSRDEIKMPNQERARLLNEPVVKEIVYEVLESAGIKRKRCEKCGALFFAKSPAAKQCDVCRSKVVDKPKTKETDNVK